MDLKSALNYLHHEYIKNPYPLVDQRRAILKTIKSMLQNHAYDIAEAISRDFSHRPVEETLYLEIFPTINAINFCLKRTKGWMKRRSRHISWMMLPAKAHVIAQPLGVVGVVTPWNYPLYLGIVPAIYAIAAGNRVMVKMSEFSPATGKLLERLVRDAGLVETLIIINGDVEVAKEFTSLPFNHLFFTGSPAVGRMVMKAASEHLTPVTLELGGKSPAILSESMNSAYFKRLFIGKCYNAGQTCVAPDYLLVPKGWEHKVEVEFDKFIRHHYPDLLNNSQYASIASDHQIKRLLELVDDAREKGATIVSFGELSGAGRKLPFYLLFHVNDGMRVMQEEIFGPILPVMTYSSFDIAVEHVNKHPHPLALYYFGNNKEEKQILETRTLSGALTINETILHIAVDDLPFGGVGNSGMGAIHGQEGFDTFSKIKPVMTQRRISPAEMMYPPYGFLLRLLLRWFGGIKPQQKGVKDHHES